MDQPAASTDPQPSAPEPIICPNCGAPVLLEGDQNPATVHCPYCEADFSPAINTEPEEANVEWEEPADPEDELDGLRIRKLVQARRSAIRARTYAIIIMTCCLVMGAQLILTDIQEVNGYGWDRWAILYAILAGLMAVGATISSRKAAVLHRESQITSTIESEHIPHFNQLSDGSQRVKNLEQMRGENDE